MNIQQVVASGNPFKRPNHDRYLVVDSRGFLCVQGTVYPYECNQSDLMSDDWEIKESSITITKSQLIEKIEAARMSLYTTKFHHYLPYDPEFINALVEEIFPTK